MKIRKLVIALLLTGIAVSILAQGKLPYSTIDEPEFVAASEAKFLLDDDILIGVSRGNVAKAYMVADLSMHGGVHDQMPDGPISVTFCITCNTGAVFRTEVHGTRLHFDYDSMVGANEVHKDRETGSRWQQITGEAISGPLEGTRLELYPFVRTTWKEWRRRFPNTVVLKPLPGYAENIPNRRTRINEGIPGGPSAPQGAFGNDDRLRPKEIVAGLEIGDDTKAFPFSELRIARVVNDRVGGVPVLVVHQPSSDTTTAFETRVKDKVLRFEARNDDASSLIDLETRSTWNAYGLCLSGPLKGTQLKTLILMSEFWYGWSEFHPKTEVFTASKSQSSEATQATFKILLQEAVGNPADPKVTMFVLPVPEGITAGPHTHAGAVFAYILQGDIENQVEPDPPKVFHPGDVFIEPQMQVHRMLRSLSKTDAARILILQFGEPGRLPPGVKPLIQESLAQTANRELRLNTLTLPPAWSGSGAHQHPGQVFAYIVKGDVESQVDPGRPEIYRAGDVFYEPPMHAHRLFRNRSKTEPAELLIFQVAEKDNFTAIPVK